MTLVAKYTPRRATGPLFLRSAAAALFCIGVFAADGARGQWMAGTGRSNITPEVPMWMSGYAARDRPAEGTRHDLWGKALVLEDATGKRVVLLTMDLVGISREVAGKITTRLQKELGVPRAQVALATSHTHTGPVIAGNLSPMTPQDQRQQKLMHEYSDQLVDKLVDAARSAAEGLRPAELEWGVGKATFAVNRRNNPEAEVVARRAENRLEGPVDHDVPVIAIRDATGELIAVVAGYACHATVLGDYLWSGDWPGAAQLEIERRHPEAMAFYWAGCGGDQNPLPRRTPELMEKYGREFADAVDQALAGDMKLIPPELGTAYREIDLPFGELPRWAELELGAAGTGLEAVWARQQLATWDRDGALAKSYPYPIQAWNLGGEVNWLFLGGEVVVDYAHRFKHDFGPATFVASYSNDVMAYIPSRRVLAEGGYEGGGSRIAYGLPAVWDPGVEEEVANGATEVLREARSQVDVAPQ